MLALIIRYGLPSGLQNSIIAIANVVVQSNINGFGEMAMAGCGAYSKIEGFAFLPITSFTMALTTFVGQNLGARQYERTKKGAKFGMLCSMAIAEVIGIVIFLGAPLLTAAFNNDPQVVMFGTERARTSAMFFFLAGLFTLHIRHTARCRKIHGTNDCHAAVLVCGAGDLFNGYDSLFE